MGASRSATGETECPILKALCGAVAEVNMGVSAGSDGGEAYLGFALSSELSRHGRRV